MISYQSGLWKNGFTSSFITLEDLLQKWTLEMAFAEKKSQKVDFGKLIVSFSDLYSKSLL